MQVTALLVLGLSLVVAENVEKKTEKRGIFEFGYGHGDLSASFEDNAGAGFNGGFSGADDGHISSITITKQVAVPVPHPVPVPVERKVPVLFPVKVPVHVDRPYPVHVPKPYPVPVEKHVPYPVDKPYPVPVKVPVKVPVSHPVPVPVPKPYPVIFEKPVHVPVLHPVIIKKFFPIVVDDHRIDSGLHGSFDGLGVFGHGFHH